MEEITSTNLQLILGIKEGINFDRVQRSTVIIATLNGNSLESKKIQSDCNPQYASNLVWETDKNSLRKMRCNQTPIKVECYAINDNGSREKLGYILLSVRCAQIIPQDQESNIKTNWHNILGVRNDFSNCKPKLLLYLIIKEKDNKAVNTVFKNEEIQETNTVYSNITPVWLQKEQLIQLGPPDECHDLFVLIITAQTLTNLNQLIQEFKENDNNEFCFVYSILDVPIRLKPFKLESEKLFLNEKVIIKIRTSLSVLSKYLKSRPHFFVRLKHNNITISQSEINLKTLVNTNCLQEFKAINKNLTTIMDCYCSLKNVNFKESKGDFNRDEEIEKFPNLKMHIKLQHLESKQIFKTKNIIPSSNQQMHFDDQIAYSNLNSHQSNFENLEIYSRIPCISTFEKVIHFNEGSQTVKPSSTSDILQKNKENNEIYIQAHKNYTLNVYLRTIKFLDSNPDVKNIEIRFHYPQGDLITSICNDVSIIAEQIIKLQDIKCKLHFTSTSDEIEQLLTSFAPKINICNATFNDKKCISQISLDIQKLFSQEKTECQYDVPLIDCCSRKNIGCVNISLVLEEHNTSLTNNTKEEKPLDNTLAYKIVDELETWKERQKEIFKDELRKKEEAHLTLLNEEWQRRREYLESKLSSGIQQCKILSNNLNKTTENLRLRKIQSLEKETKLIQANEELQWKYDRKLYQLQEALQKMQEEFSTKLLNLEDLNRNLLSQIEVLNEKNFELEKIRIEQAQKLETFKKASLTQDQTTTVLQQLKNLEEKLDNAQKSKSFFKEQWGKAVKEIHRIKVENQQALESQIKNNKEELDNLNLEEILHAGSTALTYDQIALNEIQREIDIINPESNLQYFKTKDQLVSPHDLDLNLEQNLVKSDLSTNSSCDKRLHMLI